MKSKRIRLAFAIILILTISVALFASLSQNKITYFYTVDEVLQDPNQFNKQTIRVMGLVEKGTVQWIPAKTKLLFAITENGQSNLPVAFTGIKPDLFREGQGAVVEGSMQNGTFAAVKLLVKHSEEYKVIDHNQKKTKYLKTLSPAKQ